MMITLLSTVKNRLALVETDVQHDAMLTRFIEAAGTIFERECGRALARTVNATFEFGGRQTELCVPCYPIEMITRFELKTNELGGWVQVSPPEYVVRQGCVVSLAGPLGTERDQSRVTYTGGYVLPGETPDAGQELLPHDLQHAAVEQVAAWFIHRDKVGLLRNWPSGGVYQQFTGMPLLPEVRQVLSRYERWEV